MNLRVLIDLIRKAERHPKTSMDIRSIAVSLLHRFSYKFFLFNFCIISFQNSVFSRFKFDGVKYRPNVISQPGVLPFVGAGSQRWKNRIMEDFIPGRPEAFPDEALTLLEPCALHRAISNTVWEHSLTSEDKICNHGVNANISGKFSAPLTSN